MIDTSIDGRLTPADVLRVADVDPRELSVFMCGPQAMLRSFQTDLQRSGVSSRRIHREYFDWR